MNFNFKKLEYEFIWTHTTWKNIIKLVALHKPQTFPVRAISCKHAAVSFHQNIHRFGFFIGIILTEEVIKASVAEAGRPRS